MSSVALSVIVFLAFLDAMAFGIVYPLFSSFLFETQRWHFVDENVSELVRGLWMGVLLSAAPLVQLILSPFAGTVSDRIGRRPVILFCVSFGIVAYGLACASIFFESLLLFLVARIFTGVCITSFAIANACIADVSKPEEKGQSYSYLSIAFGLGFALGPFVGGFFSQETSFWREDFLRPFYVCCCLMGINGLMAFFWLPETLDKKMVIHEKPEPFFPFIRSLQRENFLLGSLFVAAFLYCFGWSFYVDFIPVWWVKIFCLSTSAIGWYFTYGSIWYVLSCAFLVGRVSKVVDSLYLLLFSALILVGSVWVLFFINTPFVYWILIPIQNVAASFFFPIAATAVSNACSPAHRGRTMGLYASCESLGTGIAPIVSGPFLGVHLLMPVVIGGFSVLCAAAFIYAGILKNKAAQLGVRSQI